MLRFATLGLLFALAFAVRLGHVLEVRDSVIFESPLVDAQVYDRAAREIARDGLGTLEVPYYQPPLYPILLGIVYRLTQGSYLAPRVLQAFLGALTVVFVYGLARRGGKRRGAWIAAGLMGLYGPALYFEGELLPTTLVLFLGTAALWLLLEADSARRPLPPLAAAALLIGISSAARPTTLLLAAAAALWWVFGRSRGSVTGRAGSAAVFGALTLVPIAPFTAVNLLQAGEPVLVSYNGGINFYLGNGSNSDSLVAIQPGYAWDRLQVDPHRAKVRSRREESDYWIRRGLDEALADPASWALALGRKAIRLLDARETPRNLDFEVWRKESFLLSLPLVSFGLVAPLAFLAIALGAIERRTRGLLLLALAAVAVQNLLFFVAGRYRLEAVAVLCVLAGRGTDQALAVGLRRIPPAVWIATLAFTAFVAVDLLGERAIDPGRAAINRGLAQRRSGFHASATRSYFEALRVRPDDPDAHRLLAEIALAEGDWNTALERYDRAIAAAPDYLMALLGKAQALETGGRRAEAEEVYRQALTVDPWSSEVRLNYGVHLGSAGRTREARQMFEEGQRLSPHDERFRANLVNLDRIEAAERDAEK